MARTIENNVNSIISRLENAKQQLIHENESNLIPGIGWIVPVISDAISCLVHQEDSIFDKSLEIDINDNQIQERNEYIQNLEKECLLFIHSHDENNLSNIAEIIQSRNFEI